MRMNQNPLQRSIYEKVVRPALNQIAYDVEATVVGVNYFEQQVDAYWVDRNGRRQTVSRLNIPKDADGVFREAIEVGDKIRIAFQNGEYSQPYITMVYKNSTQENYFSKKGASIPKGIGYI